MGFFEKIKAAFAAFIAAIVAFFGFGPVPAS